MKPTTLSLLSLALLSLALLSLALLASDRADPFDSSPRAPSSGSGASMVAEGPAGIAASPEPRPPAEVAQVVSAEVAQVVSAEVAQVVSAEVPQVARNPAEVAQDVTATPARSWNSPVLGDPVGWRQETWWLFWRQEGSLFVVTYEVGGELWGERAYPSPSRSWTWPRPPQAWIDEGCQELICTRQIQGPPSGTPDGWVFLFPEEEQAHPKRGRGEVLSDLRRAANSGLTQIEVCGHVLVVTDTLSGHAGIRAWIRPQLCARAHNSRDDRELKRKLSSREK